MRRKIAAKFLDCEIAQRFAPAASEGMKKDKWFFMIETRNVVSRWKGKSKRSFDRDTKGFDQF